MPETLFQIPGIVSGVRTTSGRSLKLTIDTQENLTDEQVAKMASLHEKYGWFSFSVDAAIDLVHVANLPPVMWEEEKSPAQRLRGCLYVLWQKKVKKDAKGFPEVDFETYYKQQMGKVIDRVKELLT